LLYLFSDWQDHLWRKITHKIGHAKVRRETHRERHRESEGPIVCYAGLLAEVTHKSVGLRAQLKKGPKGPLVPSASYGAKGIGHALSLGLC
ncbi:hypothetical protein Ancab_004254, partial [Ancistrocladus abbreviatus]